MILGLDLVEWQLRVAAGEAAAAGTGAGPRAAATRSRCAFTPKIRTQNFLPGSGTSASAANCRRRRAHVRHRWRRDRRRHGDDLLRPDDRQADRPRRRPRAARWQRMREALWPCDDRRAEIEHRLSRDAGAPSGRGRGPHRHRLSRSPSRRVPRPPMPRRTRGRSRRRRRRCCWRRSACRTVRDRRGSRTRPGARPMPGASTAIGERVVLLAHGAHRHDTRCSAAAAATIGCAARRITSRSPMRGSPRAG